MEGWIVWYLAACWGIAVLGIYLEDIRDFLVMTYKRISDFVYDFRADMKGIKPIEELENEDESD